MPKAGELDEFGKNLKQLNNVEVELSITRIGRYILKNQPRTVPTSRRTVRDGQNLALPLAAEALFNVRSA